MRALAALCGLTTLLLQATVASNPAPRQQARQVAFPGAEGPAPSAVEGPAPSAVEGFGATTPGGRGGREIAVTSLADGGPGSFRAAVTTAGPRIVVFRVAGLV